MTESMMEVLSTGRLAEIMVGEGRYIGAAGAGFPSPAQDWEDSTLNLIEMLRIDRPGSFVFRVSGQSMIDAGIFDDDMLIVDRDKDPRRGDVVIAVTDGGFVVRQLVVRGGHPYLEARNSAMNYQPVRRQHIWHRCRRKLTECWPHLVD
jgi:DNA polymerase V